MHDYFLYEKLALYTYSAVAVPLLCYALHVFHVGNKSSFPA